MIRYTLLRFLVFFGCVFVLWLLGLRAEHQLPWLLVGSAVLSTLISAVVLRPFREDMVRRMMARQESKAQDRAASTTTDEAIEDASEPESYR